MPNLLPILADFLTTAQGAYPDLDATAGSSCVLLRWGSHTLTVWVDMVDGEGLMIAHDQGEVEHIAGPDPLDTAAELIVEHINEAGTACGEGHRDAKPGTFAARVWVTLYRQRIKRLDPEGRYSAQSREDRIPLLPILADFNPDDTLF